MVSTISVNFSSATELKPPEIQIFKEVLNDTLTKDYYSNIIEQYQHTSPYHLSAYLTRICHALSETLKATIKIPFGDFENIKKAWDKFTKREKYVKEKTMDSITALVNEVLEIISEKLQSRAEKTLKDILDNQLNQIRKQIDKEEEIIHYLI